MVIELAMVQSSGSKQRILGAKVGILRDIKLHIIWDRKSNTFQAALHCCQQGTGTELHKIRSSRDRLI